METKNRITEMMFEVRWYIDTNQEDTYMGSDMVKGTLGEVCKWAEDNKDGFDYMVVKAKGE